MTTITKTENLSSREYLEYMLINMGLFESQAKEIIALAIPEIDKGSQDYKISWNSPASGYPEMLYGVWFQTVKIVALPWIVKNCPNAWFRPMFDDKQMDAIKKEEGFPAVEASEAPRVHKAKKERKKKFHTTFSYSKGCAVVNGVEKKASVQSNKK